jgi:HAD superfamily hydrolase (TIGR01549 family)
MHYDAVIFDNDGILTTPTPLSVWRTANRIAFQRHGVLDPLPEHVDRIDGRAVDVLQALCDWYDLDHRSFWRTRETLAIEAQFHELATGSKTTYGDVDILRSLPQSVGVVSNNQQATVDRIVDRFDFGDVVETHYGRACTVRDLERIKPNPHYLQRAIDDLDARNPLYVGDSNVDVAAAAALGVDAAFVRRPHRREYDLDRTPTYELDGLDGLTAVLDGTKPPTGETSASR